MFHELSARCLSVESGKLVYPSKILHDTTCLYMSYRPKESFVPKQQRKWYVSVVCRWGGKISDKNLEQQTNVKFHVKTGKSASESSALLASAHGEYAMRRSSVLEWHRREHVQDEARNGQPKRKCGQSTNLVRSERGLGVRLTAEDYMNMFRGKDLIWPDKWPLRLHNGA
jgi:hypothetical protein